MNAARNELPSKYTPALTLDIRPVASVASLVGTTIVQSCAAAAFLAARGNADIRDTARDCVAMAMVHVP